MDVEVSVKDGKFVDGACLACLAVPTFGHSAM